MIRPKAQLEAAHARIAELEAVMRDADDVLRRSCYHPRQAGRMKGCEFCRLRDRFAALTVVPE